MFFIINVQYLNYRSPKFQKLKIARYFLLSATLIILVESFIAVGLIVQRRETYMGVSCFKLRCISYFCKFCKIKDGMALMFK